MDWTALPASCNVAVMRKRGEGKAALLEAARSEFERHGYGGTNTNMIARAAGYAPQTFYRHFADKRAAFIAVYEHWAKEELALLAEAASAEEVADVLTGHHSRHRLFRRSLRAMSVEDEEVGAARSRARLQQVELLAGRHEGFARLNVAEQLATVLTFERLCDAVADSEFVKCGVDDASARAVIISRIRTSFF